MADHHINHGDKAIQRNDTAEKPKADPLEAKPVSKAEINHVEQTRTNASDRSLRKYNRANLAAQEHSIELTSQDRVVSRTQPGREKDLVNPISEKAHKLENTASPHISETVISDKAVSKKLSNLSRLSPDLKQLTTDAATHIKDPACLNNFTQYLEKFQQRSDLSQAEKDCTYFHLKRLLQSKSSKLEPVKKRLTPAELWTPEHDKIANENMRAVLATDLMYHAAMTHRVDQGNFNTCNVTTQAERLYGWDAQHNKKLYAVTRKVHTNHGDVEVREDSVKPARGE